MPQSPAPRGEALEREARGAGVETAHHHGGAAPPANDARTAEILRRLRSVHGHVRGVERMVEDGAYCVDVVNQLLAVQRALKKVGGLVLERHMQTCATAAIRGDDPEERERAIGEVLRLFEQAGRV